LKRPLEGFFLREEAYPEDLAAVGKEVRNLRTLQPTELIKFASPETDPFVPLGKYYKNGAYQRRPVFVAEVPDAKVYLPTGLVCTRSFKALVDRGLEHRVHEFGPFRQFKPRGLPKLRGTYSTLSYCFANNFWHWMVDCLPKLHSLTQVAPTGVTLLMPPVTTEFQRETLRLLLPKGYEVRYDLTAPWVQVENFLWPSLVSDRCMGLLPDAYYRAIRDPILEKLALTTPLPRTERIYVSRAKANKRRARNEDEVVACLARFGIRRVFLEEIPFRDMVELFLRAELVVGPHGAGLGSMFFAGPIPLVVLYPTRVPPNYFHSVALGLGQKHYHVLHDETEEDADFTVNIAELERVLRDEVRVEPKLVAAS
jgi:capsular polysaccharide biosynthesis protein